MCLSSRNSSEIRDIRWKRIINLVSQEMPGNVLDIGCSSGDISSFIVGKSINVFGVDIVFGKLCEASRKRILPVCADISKTLPYGDRTFNCVLAGEVIEHVIDTDGFLDEINRILMDNGILIITTPNLANLENRIRLLIGRYPIFVDYTARGDNHVRVYTGRALIKQLKERGFQIQKYTGSFVPFISYSLFKKMTSRLMPILAMMGSLFPSLAIHAIIKARKK